MIILLLVLLLISVFFEGTVTTLPLVFICLVCLTIRMRSSAVFFIAFLAGIFLDTFALRPIGVTSIFLLTAVLLILLYQRKYEINSYPFVFIASFLGSFLYLLIFTYQNIFMMAGLSAVIAVLLFAIIRLISNQFSLFHFEN